jgi:hypothetical protein
MFFQPPLVQACFHGDPDEVRALLYKKEDVNYQVNFCSSKVLPVSGIWVHVILCAYCKP